MRNAQCGGELALAEFRGRSDLSESLSQGSVFGGMSRLPHCSHDRNAVRCFQNRYTGDAMLYLPSDWQECHAGYNVTHLLRQAHAIGAYEQCSSLWIRAIMELLVDSHGWNQRPQPISVRRDSDGFCLGDYVFHNCCCLDDTGLQEWEVLARRRRHVTIIVPPWLGDVARRCWSADLREKFDLLTIDDYTNLRVLFTSAHLKIGQPETFRMLLNWYERFNESQGVVSIEIGDATSAGPAPCVPSTDEEESAEVCELCRTPLEQDNGDNWDGLCPECADKVSNYLDRNRLNDDDRDDAVQTLRAAMSVPKSCPTPRRRTRRKSS
jgi:hypothetical protein